MKNNKLMAMTALALASAMVLGACGGSKPAETTAAPAATTAAALRPPQQQLRPPQQQLRLQRAAWKAARA